MKADSIGIYIHVPFCVKKCEYCDFCSFPISGQYSKAEYIKALLDEIKTYHNKKIKVDTVFLGGGTPSLLSSDELKLIMDNLYQTFEISDDSEITLEANPGTVSFDSLREYRACSINRISFGLQSIHENELKILGRIHDFEAFKSSYNSAREAGFTNINVDIMYGIPNQTEESFMQTIDTVSSFEPEHISVYGLILEEGTPLYHKQNELVLPCEDSECNMYYSAAEKLASKGYIHYEISNYSKPGYECKHNLKYWKSKEYLGFGLSAHSYYSGKRFSNTSDFLLYCKGNRTESTLLLTESDKEFEFAMLALRLKDGVWDAEYQKKFGKSFVKDKRAKLLEYQSLGLVKLTEENVALTEKGFYLSNTILSELL